MEQLNMDYCQGYVDGDRCEQDLDGYISEVLTFFYLFVLDGREFFLLVNHMVKIYH